MLPYILRQKLTISLNRVISLISAQTKDMLIFKDRMEKVNDEVYYSTDDDFRHRVSSLKSSMICWRKGFVLMR